jgi:hypothetical protein
VKRRYYLSICLILLSLISCDFGKPKSPFDFPANKLPEFSLSSEKVYLPELINPMNINQKNDLLVVFELYRISEDKPLVHLVRKKDLSYFGSKGKTGFGPNEITDAELFDSGFDDSTFWVYSSISKRMSEFSLIDSGRQSINQFKQPEGMYMMYNMYFTSDSTFLCISASDENKLIELDINGNRKMGFGKWEKIPARLDLDNYLLGTLNKGWFRASPDKKLFVKAGIFRDRLEFFDFEEKKFYQVDGPKLELPKFTIAGSSANSALIFDPQEPYGHRDIAFGESYIYDLYGGYNEMHIQQTNVIAKTVYVLTTKGDMVAKLDLDRSVRSITVDESLGKIYGITTDEDPGIAVFDIPKELLKN